MRLSEELRVAHLPVAFEPHGVLIQVALVCGAFGLALVSALAGCCRLRPRGQYVAGHCRDTLELNRRSVALVVVNWTDRVVVTVCYVDLDIFLNGVEEWGEATGFIERGVEGVLILDCGLTVAQPGENFVPKRIYNLNLVIVCIRY
jgi:hypothetical protein